MKIVYCDFVAGCFGGACGVVIGHPLDTIKTWQQASNSRVTDSMDQIFKRNRGFNGFYRGMLFPLLTTGGVNSILFGVYGNHLRQLQRTCHSDLQRHQYEDSHIFAAGSIAGFVQTFIACPFELIKVRLQTHHYYNKYLIGEKRTPFSTFKKIVRNDGISGLYRGMVPMLFRDVLPYGIYMLAYQKTMNFLDKNEFIKKCRAHYKWTQSSRVEVIITTLAGTAAGILSWVCVIPFDVVKTLMQAERNIKYKSILHCIQVNVKEYGWRSLFRGSYMLVVRAVPVNAATFLGYEYGLEWCHNFWGISRVDDRFA